MPHAFDIVFFRPFEQGWLPIVRLAEIFSESFEGSSIIDSSPRSGAVGAVIKMLFSRREAGLDRSLLFLARSIYEVRELLSCELIHRRYKTRSIIVIDSFWSGGWNDSLLKFFDYVGFFVATETERFARIAPRRAYNFPWGTDTLRALAMKQTKTVDVLRVGRQPAEWDDDLRTAEACFRRHLSFQGRPPFHDAPEATDLALQSAYARSKVLVAHSNIAAPAPYTHATKEYFTARWTDALAHGACVAGVQPRTDPLFIDLNWDGALIELYQIDLEKNLDKICNVVSQIDSKVFDNNMLMSMKRLDWRWRISDFAGRIGIDAPGLARQLERLSDEIRRLEVGEC